MGYARQYAQKVLDSFYYREHPNDLLRRLKQEAARMHILADRINFYTACLEWLEDYLTKHKAKFPKLNGSSTENDIDLIKFFIGQDLADVGVSLDGNTFTHEEATSIRERLDEIRDGIERMTEGQRIIAGDIEGLKDLLFLGRKNWWRQAVGTVIGWVGAGLISEATAKPLLEVVEKAMDQVECALIN